MRRILLNTDLGERGPAHPVDRELMEYVDIANIACGGHAGDEESVAVFKSLAGEKNIRCAAHLSYPDREGFGRRTIILPSERLLQSLDEQLALMPDAEIVKFHGALYNDSIFDGQLASLLCGWMLAIKSIRFIIAPEGSEIAARCGVSGMKVLAEAFAERRYMYQTAKGRLSLVDRRLPYASITNTDEAVRTIISIADEGKVPAFVDESPDYAEIRMVDIIADTICIHSDSPIALEIARAARAILNERYRRRCGDG